METNHTEKGVMIEVEELNKTYVMGDEKCIAVNDVSFKIYSKQIVAIMGKSGSGKTTLLNMIGTMDCPSSGRVILKGQDMAGLKQNVRTRFRRNHIGLVFQFFHLLPMLTLEENILLPLQINHAKVNHTYFEELVSVMGLQDKLHYYPDQLSGGQQQRGAIARALIHKPDILLADEPTGNLDSTTSEEVVTLLFQCVKKYNLTFLYVTHDADMGKKADRIFYMDDGRVT